MTSEGTDRKSGCFGFPPTFVAPGDLRIYLIRKEGRGVTPQMPSGEWRGYRAGPGGLLLALQKERTRLTTRSAQQGPCPREEVWPCMGIKEKKQAEAQSLEWANTGRGVGGCDVIE